MMKNSTLFVLLFGSFAAVVVIGEQTWTDCASWDKTCDIHGSSERTVRMGLGDKWSFISASNIGLNCKTDVFGDACPDDDDHDKKCYYVNNPITLDEKDWNYCAIGDKNYDCTVTSSNNHPFSIRYGDNTTGQYVYTQAVRSFPCAGGAFGAEDFDGKVQNYCWVAFDPPQWTEKNTTWVSCAEENEECVLPIADAIYQIKMTADGYENGQVKMFSAGAVMCNTWDKSKNSASFDDWFYNYKKHCYYSTNPIQEFTENVGYWKQVELCPPGADCSFNVQFGTSSTSSSAHTSAWSNSLSSSFSSGTEFESETMTTTVSTSVSNTMSSAYGATVTESCAVNCEADENTAVYVYQWQATTQEINYYASGGGDSLTAPFSTFACYWACQTEDKAPACPPNYCDYSKDKNCQVCTEDIYGTSDDTLPEVKHLPEIKAVYNKYINPMKL